MTETVRVVCASDRAFLRHVPTMLASLRATTRAALHVSIVGTSWDARDQDRLRAATAGIDLQFLTLPAEAVAGLSHKALLSPLTYARCLMADLVDADKFIYLDVDMIACGDVAGLWAVDLGDAPAAAVYHGDGFNAGLIVVNARVWRERGLGARMIEWARENRPEKADQDTIDALIGTEILRLDPRWNRVVDAFWARHCLLDPHYLAGAKILHFITGFKPWNLGYWLLPGPYRTLWSRHRTRSGLPVAWRYEGRTIAWQAAKLLRRTLRS